MIETKQGLPNTCWQCGSQPGATWYAKHDDAARSGRGLCKVCAFPDQHPPTAAGDDLTLIEGIGPKVAAKLAAMGINSFQELVQANAEEVAGKLNRVSPDQVQGWQAEASVLSQATEGV